jgi:hypothetical protein
MIGEGRREIEREFYQSERAIAPVTGATFD